MTFWLCFSDTGVHVKNTLFEASDSPAVSWGFEMPEVAVVFAFINIVLCINKLNVRNKEST